MQKKKVEIGNMKEAHHIVKKVEEGSIAWELEIEPGDELLSINGSPIQDVFDYHYLLNEEYVELVVLKKNQEEWELEIEKEYEEDLGIVFENDFMDNYRSCKNNCVFCFIDQMPPGMRETLYFKDDDTRLSFLQGNYVTLTNMSDNDIQRIIQYHLSPINISVHTTDPQLRCEMLHNRFAGDILQKIQKLYEAQIEMNGQIVLCKGLNDGEELNRTIQDLFQFYPYFRSLSVVPVGLSKYRDHLYPLEPFTEADAETVLAGIHSWQNKFLTEAGTHFVYGSDEWYILAGREIPPAEQYDGYPQLENGVGMLRVLEEEIFRELNGRSGDRKKRKISIATGELPYQFIEKYIIMIQKKYPEVEVKVHGIRNDFFGSRITVSGLVTGQDLIDQLTGKEMGDELLIPCNMLRMGEEVFLDDVTVTQVSKALDLPVIVVDESGEAFVRAVLGEDKERTGKRRQIYEQTDRSHCGET